MSERQDSGAGVKDGSAPLRAACGEEQGSDALASVEQQFEQVVAQVNAAGLDEVVALASVGEPRVADTPPLPAASAPASSAGTEGSVDDELDAAFENVESLLAAEVGRFGAVEPAASAPTADVRAPADRAIDGVAFTSQPEDGNPADEPSLTSSRMGESSSGEEDELPEQDVAFLAAPANETERVDASAGGSTATTHGPPPDSPAMPVVAAPAVALTTPDPAMASAPSAATPAEPPAPAPPASLSAIVVAILSMFNVPLRRLPGALRPLPNMLAATLLLWVPVVWLTPPELLTSKPDVAAHAPAEDEGAHAADDHGGGHGEEQTKEAGHGGGH